MKLVRLTLAATAAFSLLAATAVLGCDGHSKTSNTASKSSCHQAGAQKASMSGCSKAATAKAGCSKGEMAKAGCAKTTTAKSGCCAKKAAAMTADACTLKPGRVSLTGTIACNHCDFQKTESCQTVLKTSEGCTYVVAGDQVGTLREVAGHQTKVVRIRGKAREDGTVNVSSYNVVGDATPNVGM